MFDWLPYTRKINKQLEEAKREAARLEEEKLKAEHAGYGAPSLESPDDIVQMTRRDRDELIRTRVHEATVYTQIRLLQELKQDFDKQNKQVERQFSDIEKRDKESSGQQTRFAVVLSGVSLLVGAAVSEVVNVVVSAIIHH